MKTDRKAVLIAYRERKIASGIFTVRCSAAERCWVGQAPDLSTIWNRISFTLRHGTHPDRELQSVWIARNGDGFLFEEVERLDDEALVMGRDRSLRARLAYWAVTLGATPI
ncbi:MAG: GIY-YIG nuclease family protein [Janthinobacterium lividum]